MTDSVLHKIIRGGHDLAPSTRERYLRDVTAWIAFAGENPVGWTRARAQEYYDSLLKRGLRPQSARRAMNGIQYAARWWAHLENNVALDFGAVRVAPERDKIEKHALTHDAAERLVDACAGDRPIDVRDFALVVTALETGMRRMSLRSMTIETTQLGSTAHGYPVAMVGMKGTNGERLPVPLSDTACTALGRWIDWLRTRGATGPVFPSLDERISNDGKRMFVPSSEPLSDAGIQKMLDHRGKRAGIGHVNPHQFRHTFVTWRTDAGYPPHEIAAMTSHTISGLGALGGYMDRRVIGERIRNSTPDWLKRKVTP